MIHVSLKKGASWTKLDPLNNNMHEKNTYVDEKGQYYQVILDDRSLVSFLSCPSLKVKVS